MCIALKHLRIIRHNDAIVGIHCLSKGGGGGMHLVATAFSFLSCRTTSGTRPTRTWPSSSLASTSTSTSTLPHRLPTSTTPTTPFSLSLLTMAGIVMVSSKCTPREGIVEFKFKPSELPQHIQRWQQLRMHAGEHCQRQFWRLHQAQHCQGKRGSKASLTKNSRGWYMKNLSLSPIAPSLCKTLRMLIISLVLILLTLGGKWLWPIRSMSALNMSRSLGILLNCISMQCCWQM